MNLWKLFNYFTEEKNINETQRAKILSVLKDNQWEWVPSCVFAQKYWILQYNARIKELRDRFWYIIENKVENKGKKRYWYFTLIK